MSKVRPSVYGIVLHVLLIALAVSTVLLARENFRSRAAGSADRPEPLLVAGASFPSYRFQDLEGIPRTVDFSRPDGPDHLLFFFTTTCPLCTDVQPLWKALYESLEGRAEVLAVSFDPLETTRAYKERMELPFPVLVVPDPNAFVQRYQLTGVPFTLQVAGAGRVRGSWLGPLTEGDLFDIVSDYAASPGA